MTVCAAAVPGFCETVPPAGGGPAPGNRVPGRDIERSFTSRSGKTLRARGRLYGPAGAPLTIVLGGVSAGRRLLDDESGPGWWPGVAGGQGALDPSRRRLLGMDFIAAGAAPFPTLDDQADAALALADAAGARRFALAGASYGGVTALALAAQVPERVRRADILCAAARPHPMASAWRAIQRDIVQLALEVGQGAHGVDLARRLAMTIYRTPEEFQARFAAGTGEDVCDYLAARGAAYAACTSPQRFLALSHSMDAADIPVERITAPVRFLAVRSDRLVPPGDIRATAARMARASVHEIDSLYGHDGFLKETGAVNAFLEAQA